MRTYTKGGMQVKALVERSGRHVHLTAAAWQTLFGRVKPRLIKQLNVPGEYATSSFVTFFTVKGEKMKARVLWPFREYSQLELSAGEFVQTFGKPAKERRRSGELNGAATLPVSGTTGWRQRVAAITVVPHYHFYTDLGTLVTKGKYGTVESEYKHTASVTDQPVVHLDSEQHSTVAL